MPLREAPAPAGTRYGLSAAAASPRGAAPFEVLAIHVPAPTSPGDTADWRRDLRKLPSSGEGGLRILAGDFNATLDHAELRRLIGRGYRDAAEQAGVGLQMTWSTDASPLPAMVAIDHVLADRRIRVASARTVAIPGSDHRGVLTELVLPRGLALPPCCSIARREPSAVLFAVQLLAVLVYPFLEGGEVGARAVQRVRHRDPRARRAGGPQRRPA